MGEDGTMDSCTSRTIEVEDREGGMGEQGKTRFGLLAGHGDGGSWCEGMGVKDSNAAVLFVQHE